MASENIPTGGSASKEAMKDYASNISIEDSKIDAANVAEVATKQQQYTMAKTSSPSEAENEIVFPLLDLPPELWIRICKFAVILDHDVILSHNKDERHYEERVRQPGIARTCKIVRKEVLSNFYGSNTFIIRDDGGSVGALRAWLRAIGRLKHTQIKHLYFESGAQDSEAKAYLNKICSNGWLPLKIQGSKRLNTVKKRGRTSEVIMRYRLGTPGAAD